MNLVPHDELQMQLGNGEWGPVDVVEAEKPMHPHDEANEKRLNELREHIRKMMSRTDIRTILQQRK